MYPDEMDDIIAELNRLAKLGPEELLPEARRFHALLHDLYDWIAGVPDRRRRFEAIEGQTPR